MSEPDSLTGGTPPDPRPPDRPDGAPDAGPDGGQPGRPDHWPARWPARNTIVRVGLASAVLTVVSLGVWRALALGADGVAAAGLILSAATLLSSAIFAYLAAVWDKRSELLFPWKPTATALAIAFCATAFFGQIGERYYADQPVDVTKDFHWPSHPQKPTLTESVTLTVPKALDRISVRVLLVDLAPRTGTCDTSTFDIQRLGAPHTTPAVRSDKSVDVGVPAGIRRLELVLTVHPGTGCALSPHIEAAVFHRS